MKLTCKNRTLALESEELTEQAKKHLENARKTPFSKYKKL